MMLEIFFKTSKRKKERIYSCWLYLIDSNRRRESNGIGGESRRNKNNSGMFTAFLLSESNLVPTSVTTQSSSFCLFTRTKVPKQFNISDMFATISWKYSLNERNLLCKTRVLYLLQLVKLTTRFFFIESRMQHYSVCYSRLLI
jgi:hypothetical protein